MESLRASDDFKSLLSSFNAENVRYLIVGGFALAHYGRPRYTKDLDIWVDADSANARRVFRALASFGAPLNGLSVEDFTDPDVVFQIGVEPIRIDILTSVSGLSFAQAWLNRLTVSYGSVPAFLISREDYVTNKRASGRPSDLRDIAALEEDASDPPTGR